MQLDKHKRKKHKEQIIKSVKNRLLIKTFVKIKYPNKKNCVNIQNMKNKHGHMMGIH